ncbi:MAG: tetratricopeptide repeat protein [Gammaproteobacteria bacterium]
MSKAKRFIMMLLVGGLIVACDAPKVTPTQSIRHPDTRLLEPAVRSAIDTAREHFDQASAAGTLDAAGYSALGEMYLAHHLTDAAADCFDLAHQRDPNNIDARYLFGVASAELGRNSSAALAFREVLNAQPERHYAAYRLGEVLLRTGDVEQAAAPVTQAARALRNSAGVQALAGELALAQGRFADARDYFERALTLQPAASRLFHPLARALRGLGEGGTRALLARAADGEVILDDPRLAQIAALSRSTQMLLERGKAQISARDYPRAAQSFLEATQRNPEDVFAWASLGRTREVLGDVAGAREALGQALAIDASNATANLFLGMLHERQGDDAQAIPFYRRTLAVDGRNVRARLLLAHALMRGEVHAPAQAAYEAIAVERRSNVLARYYLGLLHLAYGRCDAAARVLGEAAQIKANFGPVLEAEVRRAAVCETTEIERVRALDVARQLEQARPDLQSAVTRAMVLRALGNADAAEPARELALTRARTEDEREEVRVLLPGAGGLTTAWHPTSPTLKPARLGRDSL